MERKVKYDYAFKLECVRLVLENHYSTEYVSKLKGLNKSNIRKSVNFYQHFGETGLLPRKNQSYTAEFKLNVSQNIDRKDLSLGQACLKFDIPSQSVIIK